MLWSARGGKDLSHHRSGVYFLLPWHSPFHYTGFPFLFSHLCYNIWITRKSIAQADVLKSRGVKNYISWQKKKTCKKASSSFPPFWSKGDKQLHLKRLPICTLGSIFQLGLLISQEARTECAFMWSSSQMTILALSLKRSVCLNGGLLVATISSTHILS